MDPLFGLPESQTAGGGAGILIDESDDSDWDEDDELAIPARFKSKVNESSHVLGGRYFQHLHHSS